VSEERLHDYARTRAVSHDRIRWRAAVDERLNRRLQRPVIGRKVIDSRPFSRRVTMTGKIEGRDRPVLLCEMVNVVRPRESMVEVPVNQQNRSSARGDVKVMKHPTMFLHLQGLGAIDDTG
jgi:hypothetical protein